MKPATIGLNYEKTMKEVCEICGDSVKFGSGKFVNRVPANDAFICAECMAEPCDICGTMDAELNTIEHEDGNPTQICDDCLEKSEKD